MSGIAVGFAAIGLIYSFADVSGAHFNPAVTFASMVTRKTTFRKGLAYVFVQCLGSVLATALLYGCFPQFYPSTLTVDYQSISSKIQAHQAFFMEFTLTFILVFIIFATAFDTSN